MSESTKFTKPEAVQCSQVYILRFDKDSCVFSKYTDKTVLEAYIHVLGHLYQVGKLHQKVGLRKRSSHRAFTNKQQAEASVLSMFTVFKCGFSRLMASTIPLLNPKFCSQQPAHSKFKYPMSSDSGLKVCLSRTHFK